MSKVTVTLTDVDTSAILDVLLATERYAERLYGNRRTDPGAQEAYNALAAIVLPLRDAMDTAIAEQVEQR